MKKNYSALKIATIFLVISVLYIIFSDTITALLLPEDADNVQLSKIQTIKGISYVFITCVIIYFLIEREISRNKVYITELEQQKDKMNDIAGEIESAKEILARRNVFIETILDNLPIGLAVNKINEGNATYMNKMFSEIYGWSKEELTDIGNFFLKVYPDEAYREQITDRILKDIDSGDSEKMKWSGIVITTGKNEKKIIEAQNIPLYDQNLMISTVQDISQRVQIEREIKDYQNSLKELTNELLLTEERQRKEIAANIHDHLSQSLVISKMKLAALLKQLTDNSQVEQLKAALNQIDEALEKSRIITYDLCPPVLYQLGLTEAVTWLAKKMESENGLDIKLSISYNPDKISESQLILTYRMIQELLTNVVKHARASEVEIEFSKLRDEFIFTISDNGIGFDKSNLTPERKTSNGFGLFAVSERLHNLNGTMSIKSSPNEGTKVEIRIPLSTGGN